MAGTLVPMSNQITKAELVRKLAELYPDDESARRILEFAGIPKALVRFGNRPIDTWFSAVSEADHRGSRADLLRVVLLEQPADGLLHSALQDALVRPRAAREAPP